MAEVWIYAFLDERSPGAAQARSARWQGEVNWPGAPRPGDTWFHCGEWAGETVDRSSFSGPDDGRTHLNIELRTTREVLDHLIADHGFSP